jgi:NADH:ubiquinone oxidoreductase subunit 6 (subunit J)
MWKDIEPFVGLVLTTILLAVAHSKTQPQARAFNKDIRRKQLVLSAGAVVGLLVFAMLIVVLGVPAKLQSTHPKIIAQKEEARGVCVKAIESFDFGKAEDAIRDSSLSKQMYADYRKTRKAHISHSISPLFNQIAFRTGALCSLLPVFALLFLHLLVKFQKQLGDKIEPLIPFSLPSDADWSLVLLPALDMATAYTWFVNLAFHFWLRERQVTSCMLLSGHWYTFAHTIACFALAAAFFVSEGPAYRAHAHTLAAWLVVYLALALNVLTNSQMYHHDHEESAEGLRCFGFVVPLASAAALFVLDRALAAGSSKQGGGSWRRGTKLTKGLYCEVIVAHDSSTDSGSSVRVGDMVQVQANEDEAGWVEVTIAAKASADGKKGEGAKVRLRDGWVPAYCLCPTEVEGVGQSPAASAAASTPAPAPTTAPAPAPAAAAAAAPAAAPATPAPAAAADPKLEKYVKMRKMKMPDGAVRQKMAADGIDAAEIETFLGGGGDSAGGKPANAAAPAGAKRGVASSGLLDGIKGGVKLKKAPAPQQQPPKPKPLNPLLAALQGAGARKNLKKAPKPVAPPKPKPAGAMAALEAAIAKRRAAIKPPPPVESESGDGDDVSDNEWDE